MTKRITSEDCEGNIEDIEDGRYNSHVVPVASEDDPGYEEIDYGDCTEFTVPLGRYGSHVVPIGGGGGGSMKACADGGLEIIGTGDDACMVIKTVPGGALVLDRGVLKIDSTKLKVTADNVLPAGTDPGLVSTLPVFTDPDGNVWNNQSDYNKWLYEDQKRQDQEIEDLKNAPAGSEQMVFWGILPKDAPNGAIWTDQDTLKMYVHTGGGTWAQVAQCTGGGETITTEEPWIYISDLRTMRQYSSTAWGSVKYCQKIMLYDWHYNDAHPGDVTQEWEWDENNDGNWVPYKPENDPYALTDHNYWSNSYWTYEYAPESNDGTLEMDPAHPHPCTKLRVRLRNTWDTGETDVSEWAECFLAKSCVEANGETLQPPSTC